MTGDERKKGERNPGVWGDSEVRALVIHGGTALVDLAERSEARPAADGRGLLCGRGLLLVSVDHLSLAGIDFAQTPIALIPDTELPPSSITGGVGLPLLAKFRLIIDYSQICAGGDQ